jgi:hypothetical protein
MIPARRPAQEKAGRENEAGPQGKHDVESNADNWRGCGAVKRSRL